MNGRVKLNDCIFIEVFALWPFFCCLIYSFRFLADKVGTGFPVYFLMFFLVVFGMIRKLKMKRIEIGPYLAFFAAVVLTSYHASKETLLYDFSVILCGSLFYCLCKEYNGSMKGLYSRTVWLAVIVAVCLFADSATHVFSDGLKNLYTDSARKTIDTNIFLRKLYSGIFPYSAMSAMFILNGLAILTLVIINKMNRSIRFKRELIIAAILGFGMILIQKRAHLLFTILGLVIVKLISRKRTNTIRVKQTIIVLTMIIAIVIMYFKIPLIQDSVNRIVERFTTEEDKLSGRDALYAIAIAQFYLHPFLGIGWGRYRGMTLNIFGVADATYEAHNVYLQLLCETGIVGFLSFLIMVGVPLYRSIKRIIEQKKYGYVNVVAEYGLFLQIFFLLYCLTGNPLYDYYYLITYFLGVVLSLKCSNAQLI